MLRTQAMEVNSFFEDRKIDAVISGRTGTALLIDGDSSFSFEVHNQLLTPRQPYEWRFLFGDAKDLRYLEETSLSLVKETLQCAYNDVCALDLMMIILDSKLSDDVRQKAVEAIETLLIAPEVVQRLESILYSQRLPDVAVINLNKVFDYCDKKRWNAIFDITINLRNRQRSIHDVSLAWDMIPEDVFPVKEQKEEFKHAAIQ